MRPVRVPPVPHAFPASCGEPGAGPAARPPARRPAALPRTRAFATPTLSCP